MKKDQTQHSSEISTHNLDQLGNRQTFKEVGSIALSISRRSYDIARPITIPGYTKPRTDTVNNRDLDYDCA